MSTALVTGISGFIGSSIARALLAEGATVRGIDNLSTGNPANIEDIRSRIDFRKADPPPPTTDAFLPASASPYAAQKLPGDTYLASYARVFGLETVSLRYFNVFGPHQDPSSQYSGVLARFISLMLAGETPTIFGDG